MILCTRVEARDFRVLFARCSAGRARGPAPPLLIRFAGSTRTLCSTTDEGVVLMHSSVVEGERDELLVLPGSILGEVEGSTDEGVKLDRQSKLRGVLHWHTGDQPRTLPVELILPGKQHEIPALPSLTSVPPKLLSALHECGRSAARDSGRFALSKIQFQGKSGRVIGTDGKAALVCRGFKFGFTENVLVAAVPVFGAKPLSRVSEVHVGRTATHLVVVAGPWSVWLPTDDKSRYPDVAGIIPRQPPTIVEIDEQDAVELLRVLPTLPGNSDENRPVTITIEANGTVTIRGRDPNSAETKESALVRSRTTGTPTHLTLDRRFLARALSLGCHTLKLTPDKPFVLEGNGISFVALPLDSPSVEPAATVPKPSTAELSMPQPSPDPERNQPMEPAKLNGHTPPRGDPSDPLFAAEELRDALADATTKAARLVAVLKAGRKEKKVLASVFANLKQLGLDTGGPP